jgi:hypothetical protein
MPAVVQPRRSAYRRDSAFLSDWHSFPDKDIAAIRPRGRRRAWDGDCLAEVGKLGNTRNRRPPLGGGDLDFPGAAEYARALLSSMVEDGRDSRDSPH